MDSRQVVNCQVTKGAATMIIDHIMRGETYSALRGPFRDAFLFLRRADLASLPPGTYEIDDRRVYALVQDYDTKLAAEGRWEAHRRYIDLQYVVSGAERFGVAPAGRMASGPYDEDTDMERPVGAGEFVTLLAGEFIVLWPGEAHMPGMAIGQPAAVRKIVVKIAADLPSQAPFASDR
jgi:YhcH/YjgK/YiaL family protein